MNLPNGFDPREYSYATINFTFPDAVPRLFAAPGEWILLKVALYAAGSGGALQVSPADTNPASAADIPVAANGSLCLEPGGFLRGGIVASGNGALLVVEFLYQTTPEGNAPVIQIT